MVRKVCGCVNCVSEWGNLEHIQTEKVEEIRDIPDRVMGLVR